VQYSGAGHSYKVLTTTEQIFTTYRISHENLDCNDQTTRFITPQASACEVINHQSLLKQSQIKTPVTHPA